MIISQAKLKVLERSTGDKKVEEWTFLPADWNYALRPRRHRPIMFEKNFAILKFHEGGETWGDTGGILVLNLITRRSFWMLNTTLITQIKEKAAGRIDMGNLWTNMTRVRRMIIENDRLVMDYGILLGDETRIVGLG